MKKLIMILALATLISCEKEEPTFCWECEVSVSSQEITFERYCDLTKEQIEAIEKAGTYTKPYLYCDGVPCTYRDYSKKCKIIE